MYQVAYGFNCHFKLRLDFYLEFTIFYSYAIFCPPTLVLTFYFSNPIFNLQNLVYCWFFFTLSHSCPVNTICFFFFLRHLVFLSLSVSFGFLPSLLIGPLFLIWRLSLTVIDEWWFLAAGLHCRLTKSLAKLFTKGLLSAFGGKKLVKLSLAVTQKTENVLIHSWHQVRLWSRILKE